MTLHQRHSSSAPAALALLAFLALPAWAQGTADNWPVKPVTLVVPFAAGGPVDIEARRHARKLGELSNQSFLVDYKPGAGETIGTTFVARAAPDGYTVLVASSSFTISPYLYKGLAYDITRDFTPVSLVSQRSSLILAHPSFTVKNFADFLGYAKANPGKMNYGTSGAGGVAHLAGAWLAGLTGIKVTFVHYKGAGPLQVDMVAGRVETGAMNVLAALPHIKSGKLVPIALQSDTRSPLLPGIPTVAEQGVAGYNYRGWFGIVAPAATPAAVVNRLSDLFSKTAKSADVAGPLAAEGVDTVGSTPAQFRAMIAAENERWKKLIQENGIRLED